MSDARGVALPTQPQDESIALRPAPKIFKDTCRIDFSQPAAAVHNFIRGLSPYPAAWCNLTLNGQTYENVKVFAAAVVAAEQGTKNKEQGLKGHILVPCGDGNYIDLLELQLPGKKRMDAKSLLNGLK